VVSSGDPSAQEAQASNEAKIMRLRGYGNSIVPAVAEVFIRAWMEATGAGRFTPQTAGQVCTR
jgi:hypothetical protein